MCCHQYCPVDALHGLFKQCSGVLHMVDVHHDQSRGDGLVVLATPVAEHGVPAECGQTAFHGTNLFLHLLDALLRFIISLAWFFACGSTVVGKLCLHLMQPLHALGYLAACQFHIGTPYRIIEQLAVGLNHLAGHIVYKSESIHHFLCFIEFDMKGAVHHHRTPFNHHSSNSSLLSSVISPSTTGSSSTSRCSVVVRCSTTGTFSCMI